MAQELAELIVEIEGRLCDLERRVLELETAGEEE